MTISASHTASCKLVTTFKGQSGVSIIFKQNPSFKISSAYNVLSPNLASTYFKVLLVGKHMSSSAGFAKRVEKFCKERQDLALLALVARKRNGGIECYETKPTMPMADDLKVEFDVRMAVFEALVLSCPPLWKERARRLEILAIEAYMDANRSFNVTNSEQEWIKGHKLIFSVQRLPIASDQNAPATVPVSHNEVNIALLRDGQPHRNPESFGFGLVCVLSHQFHWKWDLHGKGMQPGSKEILALVMIPNCPSPPRTPWKRSAFCSFEQFTTSPFPAIILGTC
nr:hypothetical protein GW17_00010882 [Ipomoea batatas]